MNKAPLLLLTSIIAAQTARAQQMMPGWMAMSTTDSQQGTCVLRDSSRVKGRLWLTPTKAGELLVKTEDDQQFNYTPAQLAYFTFGTAKYITIDFPNEKGSPATRPVFAQVVATGKIEAIRYSFVRNVGGLLVSTLLVRPIGSSTWTSLPENGGLKQLREVVGPLVADQPSFARVLASGRINYDNLLEYIVSYNGYVAKQP